MLERYDAEITAFTLRHTMLTQILFAIPNVVSREVPTAGTNGRRRVFNPEFMDSLTKAERVGLLVHEVLHDALLHRSRRGNRLGREWNYACDYVINALLRRIQQPLPPWGMFDDAQYGRAEEDVYDDIVAGKLVIPQGYEPDLLEGGPALTDGEIEAMRAMAKQAGAQSSGLLSESLHKATEVKINWRHVLARYLDARANMGRSYGQICRYEYARSRLCAPVRQSASLGVVVVSVDESGSITNDVLARALATVNDLVYQSNPQRVVLQHFDTEVVHSVEMRQGDTLVEWVRRANGGTSFVDCCAKAERQDPVVHIVITDLQGKFPAHSTVDTIWLNAGGKASAPFGQVLEASL